MVTLSRKKREIAERESQILKLARPILIREGYQGLSMDRLASLMEYAKGTLYNHFPNKEEIVLALAIESMEMRFQMFEYAASLSTESRNRLCGIGAACETYTQCCREHFVVEDWIRNSLIWDKSSSTRQELIQNCEARCMGIVSEIARQAIVENRLVLPPGLSPQEFIFGFWSMNYGSQILAASSPSLAKLGVTDAPMAIRRHCHTLMHGFNWKPLIEFDEQSRLMDRYRDALQVRFNLSLT